MTRDGTTAPGRPEPGGDYLELFRESFDKAFGWEVSRALELAIFHTFAAPRISQTLDRTGEFTGHCQKRYDDTVALLREIARDGPLSARGKAAIKRMNWIHRGYGISNDDMLYVLATFVVIPVRWIGRYGWRDLTEAEVSACVRYYRELGRMMGIRQVPGTYAAFASFLDNYERDNHAFTEPNRRLALSLIQVFGARVPPVARPLVRGCVTAALGGPLRRTLGLPEPNIAIRAGTHAALRFRAALVRAIPPLRCRRGGPRRLRTYPHGYQLSDLGPAWAAGKTPGSPRRLS